MDESQFHFQLGDFKCIAVRDGGHVGSADFLFVNTPPKELEQALAENNLERDKLPSSWTCLLVDTGEKRLLVDTGVGSLEPRGGKLLSQLAQLGYPAGEIDMVFLTHGHPDHVGGCTDEDERPAFRNARYLIGEKEFNYWTGDQPDPASWMAQVARQKLLAVQDQLELVGGDSELLPGIRTIEAYGHTPGHLGLEIQSQGQSLLNLADAVLHPLHLQRPEWVAPVDVLPEQMISTRQRLLERAAREEALVLFFHFDFPSLGYVEQEHEYWRWRPI
ncbi:MAG TPA: MBL fold metallo-hydrolase [Anaerolineae bacterium]|nr:MBL fold metallo-hydrolase [Anaerolineae bacterium]